MVVVGKYLAGLFLAWVLFCSSVLVSYLLIYPPFGISRALEDLTAGPGGSQLIAYLGVTLLACVGYGAVFLILGLLFKDDPFVQWLWRDPEMSTNQMVGRIMPLTSAAPAKPVTIMYACINTAKGITTRRAANERNAR